MDYKPGFDRRKWTITWHYINLTIVPLFGVFALHVILMVMIYHVGSQFHGEIEESIEVKKLELRVAKLNANLKIKSQNSKYEPIPITIIIDKEYFRAFDLLSGIVISSHGCTIQIKALNPDPAH